MYVQNDISYMLAMYIRTYQHILLVRCKVSWGEPEQEQADVACRQACADRCTHTVRLAITQTISEGQQPTACRSLPLHHRTIHYDSKRTLSWPLDAGAGKAKTDSQYKIMHVHGWPQLGLFRVTVGVGYGAVYLHISI